MQSVISLSRGDLSPRPSTFDNLPTRQIIPALLINARPDALEHSLRLLSRSAEGGVEVQPFDVHKGSGDPASSGSSAGSFAYGRCPRTHLRLRPHDFNLVFDLLLTPSIHV